MGLASTHPRRGVSPMKFLSLGFCVLLLVSGGFAPTCLAETLWVDDQNSVTLHTGPDPQNRIVAVVGSGQALEAVSRQGGWTRVRLAPGRDGWAISRYLTGKEPKSLLYDGVQKALVGEKAKAAALEIKTQELKRANEALTKSLFEAQNQASQARAAYDALAKDSGQALALRRDLDKVRAELAILRQEAFAAKKRLEDARSGQPVKWFLAGAGVIAAGIVLGLVLKGRRRQSRF